jgi:hypothetical protein
MYGFVRIHSGDARGSYAHNLFIRGKPEMCRFMVRTKIKSRESKTNTGIGSSNEKLLEMVTRQYGQHKSTLRRTRSMDDIVPAKMTGVADHTIVSMPPNETQNQIFSQQPMSPYLFNTHQTQHSIFQRNARLVDKDIRMPTSNITWESISKKDDVDRRLSSNLFYPGFQQTFPNNNFGPMTLSTHDVAPSVSNTSFNSGSDHVACKDFDDSFDDDIESIDDLEASEDIRRSIEPLDMKKNSSMANTVIDSSSDRLGLQNTSHVAFPRYSRSLDDINSLGMARATFVNAVTISSNGVPNQSFSHQLLASSLLNTEQEKHSNHRGTTAQNSYIANEIMTINGNNACARTNEAPNQVCTQHQLSSLLFNYRQTQNPSTANVLTSHIQHQIMMPSISNTTRPCTITSGDSSLDPAIEEAAARRIPVTLFQRDTHAMPSNDSRYPEILSVAREPSWMDGDDLDDLFDDDGHKAIM